MPKGRDLPGHSQDDANDFYNGTLNPLAYYTSGTDDKGHFARARDVRFQQWLQDVLLRLSHEIPAYKGDLGNIVRDCCTHWASELIARVTDPKTREALMKDFQLHVDLEEQSREIIRFSEMQRYVTSCETTLKMWEKAKRWMRITQQVEQMKKRISDGLLWEPHQSTVEGLIEKYEGLLRNQP